MLSFRRIGHVFMVMVPNYQCHHSRTHKKSNKKSAAGKPPPPPPKNTISHQPNATTTRNGRMVVCTKTSVWASHWLVAPRAFYGQFFFLVYSFLRFWNFCPRLARLWLEIAIKSWCCPVKSHNVTIRHICWKARLSSLMAPNFWVSIHCAHKFRSRLRCLSGVAKFFHIVTRKQFWLKRDPFNFLIQAVQVWRASCHTGQCVVESQITMKTKHSKWNLQTWTLLVRQCRLEKTNSGRSGTHGWNNCNSLFLTPLEGSKVCVKIFEALRLWLDMYIKTCDILQ